MKNFFEKKTLNEIKSYEDPPKIENSRE